MIACWFKWDRADGAWIGFAMAKNKIDLFREVDQYGDPYGCKVISELRSGSYCSLVLDDGEESEGSELEVSEREPLADDDRWRAPNWPEDIVRGRP